MIAQTKESIGAGALSTLAGIIKELDAKSVLLVSGKGSYVGCGASDAIAPFLDGMNVARYSDFDVNPKFDEALDGVALCKSTSPDLIIAIGGGSVIDMAKLVSFYQCARQRT